MYVFTSFVSGALIVEKGFTGGSSEAICRSSAVGSSSTFLSFVVRVTTLVIYMMHMLWTMVPGFPYRWKHLRR